MPMMPEQYAGTGGVVGGGTGSGRLKTVGTANPSADGIKTIFSIPHGLGGIPSTVTSTPMDAKSAGDRYTTTDATYINIVFLLAPTAGTLHFTWEATA